jgi:hypothetical protein
MRWLGAKANIDERLPIACGREDTSATDTVDEIRPPSPLGMFREIAKKSATATWVPRGTKRGVRNPKSDVVGDVILERKVLIAAGNAERQQTNEEPKRAYAGHHGWHSTTQVVSLDSLFATVLQVERAPPGQSRTCAGLFNPK